MGHYMTERDVEQDLERKQKLRLKMERIKRDRDALLAAAELACVSMEERGYADMPSFTNLRRAIEQAKEGT